jgi:ABC-type nitrate/sulfonate/bicarbonate transport system ATPase subunit
MNAIDVRGLTHQFNQNSVRASSPAILAIKDLSFSVMKGEFVAVVGPSGCGKSTLLRILSGLIYPTGGEVFIKGHKLGDSNPTAYMPQRDLLLPWLNVQKNAMLGARLAGVDEKEIESKLPQLFMQFGLDGFQESWPSQLSGGMRQRLALLRTFLMPRDIILLDEPFGSLDAITRRDMHDWLQGVLDSDERSLLLVTHDVDEALVLADRVLVMTNRPGKILTEVGVEFPRPRSTQTLTLPKFTELKELLLHSLAEA